MDKEFSNYLQIMGPLPSVAGTRSGPLLIVGTAACLWDDLQAFGNNAYSGDRMAVNAAAMFPDFIGKIDHIVTLHPEFLAMFAFKHQFNYYRNQTPMPMTHATRGTWNYGQPIVLPDHLWPLGNRGHCSGLLAIFIGLLLGYDEIILAGSPVDSTGNFYGPPNEKTICGGRELQQIWQEAGQYFQGKVTSLSGNTWEWFGAPDEKSSALRPPHRAVA